MLQTHFRSLFNKTQMIILQPYINETKRYDNTTQNDNVKNINLLTDSVSCVFLICDKLTSFQRDQ